MVAVGCWYWSLVSGVSRVPTLAMAAARPALNRPWVAVSIGCSAKVRVWAPALVWFAAGTGWAVFGVIGRTPPQCSGWLVLFTVRPVTEDTPPTATGGVPGGISAMGSVPALRAL